MSKKLIDASSDAANVPFFAHLLSGQNDPATPAAGGGGPAPTYHCLYSECTKKYPSDNDEPTSSYWDK
jgi:hypothetical protein